MKPQELPKAASKPRVNSVPVWLLATAVSAVLLLLGVGWSLIM